MIFASQDPESKAFVVFLTVVVAAINIAMLIWLVVGMAKEYAHEQKEEAAKNGGKGSSLSNKLSNARGSLQRWRFGRMTPEAQQRAIRRRTIDAANGNATENPVTIEMAEIYSGESTGEIKVDDEPTSKHKKKKGKNKTNKLKSKRMQVPVRKTAAQQARRQKLRSLHTKRQNLDATGNEDHISVFNSHPARAKETSLSVKTNAVSVEMEMVERGGGIEKAEEETLEVNTKRRKSFRKIEDEEHGTFFENIETEETVWEVPKDGDVVVDEHQLQTNPMKRKSFKKIEDAEHGVYFQNVETDETFWKLPEDGELETDEHINDEEKL